MVEARVVVTHLLPSKKTKGRENEESGLAMQQTHYTRSFDLAGDLGYSNKSTRVAIYLDGLFAGTCDPISGESALYWQHPNISFTCKGAVQCKIKHTYGMPRSNMSSILRSPSISGEIRKLAPRRKRTDTAITETAAEPPSVIAADPVGPMLASGNDANLAALVEKARQSVLAQFKAEAEEAHEQGRQRGLQEGREAGKEEGRQLLATEIARIRRIAEGLESVAASQIRGVESIAVAVAYEAVCKLLGTRATDAVQIEALVKEALTHAGRSPSVLVRIHPADLAILKQAGALMTSAASAKLSWHEDESIELGGCVLETASGEIDARLETQLENLRTTLIAARQMREPDSH